MDKLRLSQWQVENMRLSVFPTRPIDLPQSNVWESLVGSPPDEQRFQRQQQLFTEEGAFLGGRLRLEARSTRLDWRLIGDSPTEPTGDIPTIGSYNELEPQFRELMYTWLLGCPSLQRMAFGCVLLLPADSLRSAYSQLNELLSVVKIDVENTRDFLFRINRRRKSRCSVEGLELNRLSTWSVVQIVETMITVSADGQGQPQVVRLPSTKRACRVELDINTIPESSAELESAIARAIYEELIENANQIAISGDIQ